jgi:DNA-binding NtrC family response regulator
MVDVRVIAATNKDLKKAIKEGRFREDLYHRLSVIIMEVPPLRERKSDIRLLVNHFIEQISASNGKPVIPIEDNAIQQLEELPWSGNVRELHNVVERLLILCTDQIEPDDIERFVKPLTL